MVSGCEPIVHEIEGRVVDSAGKGIEGVMVSAIDDEHRKWISVFSQKDGSFSVSGLRDVDHNIRTRMMGFADGWESRVAVGTRDLVIKTRPAVGDELEVQRPANSAFSMLASSNTAKPIARSKLLSMPQPKNHSMTSVPGSRA